MSASTIDREIVGATALAKRFGCSKRTFMRHVADHRIQARKLGGPTSPLRMTLAEIEAAKSKMGGR